MGLAAAQLAGKLGGMMNTITRAGLTCGLALSFCSGGGADPESGKPGPEADSRELEEPPGFREIDWTAAERLTAARAALAEGNIAAASTALRFALNQGRWGDKRVTALATAIGWQNLEFQLAEPGFSQVWQDFALPPGDKLYLHARAFPSAERFRTADSDTPGGHNSARRALATMAADEGRWDEARAAFEAILQGAPNDAETKVRYAFAAYYKGELDLALKMFASALDSDSSSADAWYGCGVAWLGRGLFESAEKALHRAVERDPTLWKAREALVQALSGQGKFAEAKPLREKLRELAPKLKRIGERITVAVLPREGGAAVVREALLDSVPWRFRIERFDQARAGGKPIKITELRRDGEAFVWGEVAESGEFRPAGTPTALPELERVLEEAK